MRAMKEPKAMQPHEFASLFPLLGEAELQQLADDIKANGQIEPIVVHDGFVLDGRNRLAACEMLGLEPHTVDYDGSDPLAFVVSKNLHRRHLTEGQRASIGSSLITMKQGRRTDLEPPANLQEVVSTQDAAQMMNVSERSVRTATKIVREAVKEILDEVKSGGMSLNEASNVVKLHPDAQRHAANLPKNERRKFTDQELQSTCTPSKAAFRRANVLVMALESLSELGELKKTPSEILDEMPLFDVSRMNETYGPAFMFMKNLETAYRTWEMRNVRD